MSSKGPDLFSLTLPFTIHLFALLPVRRLGGEIRFRVSAFAFYPASSSIFRFRADANARRAMVSRLVSIA